MFPELFEFVEEAKREVYIDESYDLMKEHLENHTVQIKNYCLDEYSKSFSLTINVFSASASDILDAKRVH